MIGKYHNDTNRKRPFNKLCDKNQMCACLLTKYVVSYKFHKILDVWFSYKIRVKTIQDDPEC